MNIIRNLMISLAALMIPAAVIAGAPKEVPECSKDVTKIDESVQIIRNNWTILKKQLPDNVVKAEEKYDKLIAKGKDDPNVVKLHKAGIYAPNSPEYIQNPQKFFTMSQEAYEAIGSDKPSQKGLAANNLGLCYMIGYGVERNDEKAFKYLKEAYDYDNNLSKELSRAYMFGIGSEPNYNAALGLIFNEVCTGDRQSAHFIYDVLWIMEQDKAGTLNRDALELFRQGIIIEESNPEKAAGYFEKAADMGFVPAMSELGAMHALSRIYPRDKTGDLDPRSQELGEKYLLMAANQGFVPAMYNYAAIMEFKDARRNFMGVVIGRNPENERICLEYHTKAAAQGYPASLSGVGVYNHFGYGGLKADIEKAFQYYVAAGMQGDKLGIQNTETLLPQLTARRKLELIDTLDQLPVSLNGYLNASDGKSTSSTGNTGNDEEESRSSEASFGIASTLNSSGAYTPSALSARNRDIREYARIGLRLADMKDKKVSYTKGDKVELQDQMRQIRERWEPLGLWFIKTSTLENW